MRAIITNLVNQNPGKVIPIRNAAIVHAAPDFDAWGGLYFAQVHGRNHFPGIETAPIKLVDKSPMMSDDQYDAAGALPFDTGYGRFDHHRVNGRLQNSSTVKLVCEYLGIVDPASLIIAEEIHWGDNNRGVKDTQLGGLIKSVNRNVPSMVISGYDNFVKPAMTAMIKRLSWNYAQAGAERSVLHYFDAMTKVKWYPGERLQEHIRKLLRESIERSADPEPVSGPESGRSYYTELDFIVRALQRNGANDDVVFDWIRFPFSMLAGDEALFEKALGEVRGNANKFFIRARFAKEDGNMRASMIRSNNPMILRAANYCEQDVVALCNKRNQMTIIINHKTGLTLDALTAMIRWYESPVETRKDLDWEDLMRDGIHPVVPNWYYERKRGQLFNGSLTHPGMQPTKIGNQGIIDAMEHAFHPKLIARWQSDRKIMTKEQKGAAANLTLS